MYEVMYVAVALHIVLRTGRGGRKADLQAIHEVRSLAVVTLYTLCVRFGDGTLQTIDSRPILAGELYVRFRDADLFGRVEIDLEARTYGPTEPTPTPPRCTTGRQRAMEVQLKERCRTKALALCERTRTRPSGDHGRERMAPFSCRGLLWGSAEGRDREGAEDCLAGAVSGLAGSPGGSPRGDLLGYDGASAVAKSA